MKNQQLATLKENLSRIIKIKVPEKNKEHLRNLFIKDFLDGLIFLGYDPKQEELVVWFRTQKWLPMEKRK